MTRTHLEKALTKHKKYLELQEELEKNKCFISHCHAICDGETLRASLSENGEFTLSKGEESLTLHINDFETLQNFLDNIKTKEYDD